MAVLARLLAPMQVIASIIMAVLYVLGCFQTCEELEVFTGLLYVIVWVSWSCVCIFPLRLHCARAREGGRGKA